jgi:hypothetical protein
MAERLAPLTATQEGFISREINCFLPSADYEGLETTFRRKPTQPDLIEIGS